MTIVGDVRRAVRLGFRSTREIMAETGYGFKQVRNARMRAGLMLHDGPGRPPGPHRDAIVEALPATTREVADALGLTREHVYKSLLAMEARGRVRRAGVDRTRRVNGEQKWRRAT